MFKEPTLLPTGLMTRVPRQSGHPHLQRTQTYGLDGAFPTKLQLALLQIFLPEFSEWHRFLDFDESPAFPQVHSVPGTTTGRRSPYHVPIEKIPDALSTPHLKTKRQDQADDGDLNACSSKLDPVVTSTAGVVQPRDGTNEIRGLPTVLGFLCHLPNCDFRSSSNEIKPLKYYTYLYYPERLNFAMGMPHATKPYNLRGAPVRLLKVSSGTLQIMIASLMSALCSGTAPLYISDR